MLVGIFLGQYCINVLTWFFLTWFPIYLVKDAGMSILQVGFVAVLPASAGSSAASSAADSRTRCSARRALSSRPQGADRRGPAAVDGDRRLQLRLGAVGRHRAA
jgi:hypothetical protein